MAFSTFAPYAAASGGAALGAGLSGMFGNYKNPADAAMPYMRRIPDILRRYANPYIEAGNRALPGMEREYGQLISSPGERMNQIGAAYHQSPGFQFALQQALQGAGHAAAAGGMAGSPQHEQQNMGIATNLANQDYNTWLSHALGLYGQGLEGEQGLYNTGANAGIGLGENIASAIGNQGQLAYAGQAGQNQREQDIWGSLGGGIGSLAALAAFR